MSSVFECSVDDGSKHLLIVYDVVAYGEGVIRVC